VLVIDDELVAIGGCVEHPLSTQLSPIGVPWVVGTPLLIVDRGRPVARLEPLAGPAQGDDAEGRLARLVERAVTPPSRRLSTREQPAELRTLQLLADLDDCRASTLDGILEPDATWSMLTELLRARLARRRLSVTSLCLASKSPVTTALRRIDRLLEAGLVCCTQDPKDRRRKYIELTADGGERLQEALRAVNQRLGGEETTFP
jgi:DNA-binding MarR family transcriptional regulator